MLRNPPGRSPSKELISQSQWYKSLPEEQKIILYAIMGDVADRVVFGILCLLDGVRAIDADPNKGRLELYYASDKSVLLNSPDGEALHELW